MIQTEQTPITQDLVLIGGGHSHLFVLKHFAMQPLPGVRLSLITRDLHTPYSGMLPGFIAGHYAYDEAHIDLQRLARHAAARLIHGEVTAVDADRRQIAIEGRPPIAYDLLSINIGSHPSTSLIQMTGNQFAVKPVDHFIAAWEKLEQRLVDQDKPIRLAIVGGGAGGVELALSLDYRAQQRSQQQGQLQIGLLTDRSTLLPTHNPRVQELFKSILARRSITVYYDAAVNCFDGQMVSGSMTSVAADAVIWVTHASPAPWLQDSGLALDDCGFIEVNECLQSQSHAQVFAAGDIAAVTSYPRPKSGVFAVRQGLPLARNLSRFVRGLALDPFKPQQQFLSLISTGNRTAVASRGSWTFKGKWCWWLKDRIDRNFMRRFSSLAAMQPESQKDLSPMHCGGCGSKLGSAILERVLAQVCEEQAVQIAAGLEYPEDAAMIEVPRGKQLIQSVDHFRAFIDDAYLFGRIAANHALGDLFAMGVPADSAMVIASVPYGSEDKQFEELYQLMSGVVTTLKAHDTKLAGGHSGEARELACGLSVNGFAEGETLMLKAGMQTGELLILTKPLGSGVLFAADMRARARGSWIEFALDNMLISNQAAAQCFQQFGASACTDVTGFGFAGHLFEMTRASACAAEIMIEHLPVLPGAAELAGRGLLSSLQPQNTRIRHQIRDPDKLESHPYYPLLFDPQTAGGLLASIAVERAEECLARLRELGYGDAQIVARVTAKSDSDMALKLLSA